MEKIVELCAYTVPDYATPDHKPSKIVPCPFCRHIHVAPADARYVALSCSTNGQRPDYADLIDCGPAIRPLLGAFLAGDPLSESSDLWQLQPKELSDAVHTLSTEDAAKLGAVDLG